MSDKSDTLGCEGAGQDVRMVRPYYTPSKPTLTWDGQPAMSEAITKAAEMALEALIEMTKGNERDSETQWGRVIMPKNDALNKAEKAAQALRAALSQAGQDHIPDARQMVGQGGQGEVWQPMATAPKDGKKVLVWWDGAVHEAWCAGEGKSRDGGDWWRSHSLSMCSNRPTHWRPKPPGPAAQTPTTPQPAPVASVAGPEDIEAIIACLGDDAATLRDESPEIADNLDAAAEALRKLTQQPAPAVPAELSDEEVVAALEVAGVRFQRFMGGISGTKDCWNTSGSQDVRKIANGVRALLSAAPKPAGKDGV